MSGLWTAFILVLGTLPWVQPQPGIRTEPARPAMTLEEFGPASPYRQLLAAGKLPEACDIVAVEQWTQAAEKGKWNGETTAQVKATVAVLEPNLALARQVAMMPEARVPTTVPFDKLDEAPQAVRNLNRVLRLSAYYREQVGDTAGAFADLLTVLRLANVLTRGGSTTHRSTAWVVSAIAIPDLWQIAIHHRVPPTLLQNTAWDLLEIAQDADPPGEAIRNAVPHTLAWSDLHWDPHEIAQAYGMDLNKARAYCLTRRFYTFLAGGTPAAAKRNTIAFAGLVAGWADAPYRPEIADRLAWLKGMMDRHDNLTPYFMFQDMIGFDFSLKPMVLVPEMVRGHSERMALLRGTALALAVQAYQTETGRTPGKLDDLVPQYLPIVPDDPFDGKPFRYVTGKTPRAWGNAAWGIYSIGGDFRDNGGKATALAGVYQRPPNHGRNPDLLWLPQPLF